MTQGAARQLLRWYVILVGGIFGYIALVLGTARLLLSISWFYFFWSFGLSGVASYMLTDFATKKVFEKIAKQFSISHTRLRAASYLEMIFATTILASLVNYAFQNELQNNIDIILLIAYPLLGVLAWLYYKTVFAPSVAPTPP